jgi:hypothetical protein
MAQTTNQMSMRNCKIEISTNGSTWTDIGGFANEVVWDGGERITGSAHTFDGDKPVQTVGKQEMKTATLKVLYTEGASDPAVVAQTAYDNASALYARWSPKGGLSGQKMYTTDAGIVKKPVYPQGEAGSGDPIAIEIEIETPGITPSTVA